MVCQLCRSGNHDQCIVENARRDYQSCDCQHRQRKISLNINEFQLLKEVEK